MKPLLNSLREFGTWSEAFTVCRERRRPINVSVPINSHSIEIARIFPRGRCKHIAYLEKETL